MIPVPRALLSCVLLVSLTGCADSPLQHRAGTLPPISAEQRAQVNAREARIGNPGLSKAAAASQGAAESLAQETQAEVEWRQSQKAAAERERYLKDLEKVTGGQ